jgi:hypothetical protein
MYPILETWVVYEHRFNELASKFWGLDYTTAEGIVPFHEPSPYSIDDGATEPYQKGQYYPDMTSSEVTQFYAKKLGYDSVFTTNFQSTMENLNRGVLQWIEIMHGYQSGSGIVSFWKDNKKEENPWRGYEQGGSTKNPDTLTFMRIFGYDILPSEIFGSDGIVIAGIGQFQTQEYNGEQIDDALENVHSAGFMGGSCLIGNTVLHLALIRHGFVYQVIDPWISSWYSAYGFQIFIRELALGATLGEAYDEMIRHMGILYMTNGWWWDTSENIEYFGDPDLRVYSPYNGWDKPSVLSSDLIIDGHSLLMAKDHGKGTPGFEAILLIAGMLVLAVFRKRK